MVEECAINVGFHSNFGTSRKRLKGVMLYVVKIMLSLGIAVLTAGLCDCTKSVSISSAAQTSAQLPDELLVGVVTPLLGKFSQGPADPNLGKLLSTT